MLGASRMKYGLVTLLLISLATSCVYCDVSSQLDDVTDLDDEAAEYRDMADEMNQIPDWSLPTNNRQAHSDRAEEELQFLLDHLDSFSSRDSKENAKSNHVSDQEEPLEESDSEFAGEVDEDNFEHLVAKRSLHSIILEIIRDMKEDLEDIEPASRGCSEFQRPSAIRSVTSCGSVNTSLGSITYCHVTCRSGYRLRRVYPTYEVCGAATKYRWTYQLKGMSRPEERCVHGMANYTQDACTTPECLSTAAYYMNKIDFTVHPCDDFFQFACGRWLNETGIPPSKSHYLTYTVIRDRVTSEVGDLLGMPITVNDSDAVAKAKTFYKSCLNIDLINEKDSEPILDLLRGDMAWPIIQETWDENSFDFEATAAALRGKYNNKLLLDVIVGKLEGRYILQIWKGKMPLPYKYYSEDRYSARLTAYYALMYDVAVMLGADPQTALDDVSKVAVFENKLADHKNNDFDFYTNGTIDEYNTTIPGINWLSLLTQMVRQPITGSTRIEVLDQTFLTNLIQLIHDTDKRVVQNYMVWTTVKLRIKDLSERFQRRYLQFESLINGKQSLPTRKAKCAQDLIFSMKGPTSKLFIDAHFSAAKKKAAKDLFEHIRKGFLHLLNTEVQWMDNATKAYAREKALAIKSHIGYNRHIYQNETYLDLQLEHLVVAEDDFFGNFIRLLEVLAQNKFKKIGKPYNSLDHPFTTRPTMVNAYYSPLANAMTLPAGEMQYPFYWGGSFPEMFQFGAIGTILGHEFTHAFDNLGRKYGIDGELLNWWSPASLSEFNKRTKCMADQYSNYYWESARDYLDGQKTLSENIADNGGIRESYAGYHIWLQSKNLTHEQVEPATGFTNDQMFFIGFANDRCGQYTHRGAVHNLARNVHSPGRFRVIGSLQNFEMFSRAFHCPVGSYMNPRHKCIVW